jgi:hypothetical protein
VIVKKNQGSEAMILLFDKGWRKAAQCLEDQGYTLKVRSPGLFVVPAIFEKASAETVYLVRPLLDNRYHYLPVEDAQGIVGSCGLIDANDDGTLIYQHEAGIEPPTDWRWVPRTWRSRPKLGYGVRDAAEHAGTSMNSIKTAAYRDARAPLLPAQMVGGKRIIMFDEEGLAMWIEHRRRGAGRGDNFRSRDHLKGASKTRLARIIRTDIIGGDTALANRLVAAVEPLNGRKAPEILAALNTPAGLDSVMELAMQLERSDLIDVATTA